jgi:predicted N-acetyltransferase YhbS
MQIVECTIADEIQALSTAFDPAQFEAEHADVHVMAVDDHQGPAAECSIWWSQVPPLPHQRVGVIGHYSAANDSAAQGVLAAACDRLRRAACTCAIGPMDGNTWRRYRFVTEAGTEPPFFLEPQNPPEWPRQFDDSGFAPLATYFSSLTTDLSQRDERLARVEHRLHALGVNIRPLRAGEFEECLPRIYRMACIAFKNNYLFTPQPEADFIRQYRKVAPFVVPDLVLVAERGADLVGFVLVVPDLLQRSRGVAVDTAILKTIAVLPHGELSGLGILLVGRVKQIGRELGFRRGIGALMQEENKPIVNISRGHASPMRRYTLYAKDLRS